MAYNYFNMGNQVMFPFKSNSPFPVDSKLVAESVTQALTLPTSSRFVGMPVFIINENKWYSFKGSIDDSSLSPIEGGASSDLSFELFSETKTYAVDDYVVHDFKLYQAIATSTGTWDSTKGNFNLVIGEDRQEETFIKIKGDFDKTVQYEVDDYVVYNQNVYKNVVPNTVGDEFNIAQWNLYIGAEEETFIKIKEVYNENNNYVIGEKVVFENNIYNCIVDTTGVFNKDNWELFVGYIPEETVVFNEWVSGTTYEVDDFVIHDCKLYKCITANSDIDFTESNWIMSIGYIDEDGVKITEWITGNEYKENDFVLQGGNLYKCIAIHTSNDFEAEAINWELVIEGFKNDGDIVITEWTVGTDYEIGDFVLLNGNLYKCITAHTSNDFDLEIANWEIVIKGFEDDGDIVITEWVSANEYKIDDFVLLNGNLYKCTADNSDVDFTDTNWQLVIEGNIECDSISLREWTIGVDYEINDFVIFNKNIYKCNANHTSADFELEIANWDLVIESNIVPETILINDWKDAVDYVEDEYVLHENCLYKCILAHTSTIFVDDIAYWELILDGTTCKGIQILEWKALNEYTTGQYVLIANSIYQAKTDHTSSLDFNTDKEANWNRIIASGDTNVAENILYSNSKMATVDNVKSALDEIINRLNHVDLEITLSTTPSDLVNEIGSTISSVVFNWSYNKDVVLQTLTDCTLADETVRTATYTTPFDTEKTFVLDATDDEGATGSKEVKFTFLPNIYYGGAVVPNDYDDTFILGLGNKELKENAVGTYKLTTGADEYVYIAIPKIYHDEAKLIANVGGFNTELGLMATVNHTNASGYAQDYNIYRSGQKGLGKLTIIIED